MVVVAFCWNELALILHVLFGSWPRVEMMGAFNILEVYILRYTASSCVKPNKDSRNCFDKPVEFSWFRDIEIDEV